MRTNRYPHSIHQPSGTQQRNGFLPLVRVLCGDYLFLSLPLSHSVTLSVSLSLCALKGFHKLWELNLAENYTSSQTMRLGCSKELHPKICLLTSPRALPGQHAPKSLVFLEVRLALPDFPSYTDLVKQFASICSKVSGRLTRLGSAPKLYIHDMAARQILGAPPTIPDTNCRIYVGQIWIAVWENLPCHNLDNTAVQPCHV